MIDKMRHNFEHFMVLAPLREEKVLFNRRPGGHFKVENTPRGNFSWGAFHKLYKHIPDQQRAAVTIPPQLVPSTTTKASSVEQLPQDILFIILSHHNLTRDDAISLALTSKALFIHVLEHVQYLSANGPWTNTPIVCAGSTLDTIPDSLSTPFFDHLRAEQADFDKGLLPWQHRPNVFRDWRYDALFRYKNLKGHSKTEHWQNALSASLKHVDVCREEENAMRDLLCQATTLSLVMGDVQGGSKWYLRNLSTNEYVVLQADEPPPKKALTRTQTRVALKRKRSGLEGEADTSPGVNVHVLGRTWFSLDKLMLLRVTWCQKDMRRYRGWMANYRGLGPPPPYSPRQGLWAGHRFDVVNVESYVAGEDWQDVTDAVIAEADGWVNDTFEKIFHWT